MHFNIFKTAAWQLIRQADPMCWIILLCLLMASIFCIAIVAFKYFSFKTEKRKLDALALRMKKARSFTDLITISKEFHDGIGGRFLVSALSELKILLDEKNPVLSDVSFAILENELVQSVENLIAEQEEYLPVLSTSAMSAPLVGLFGTIWGLIHAFIDISQEKSADIATVAPGLAEALIVTLGGLAVAIPALISFHYFATKVRTFDRQLNEIGDRFLNIMKQTFVK